MSVLYKAKDVVPSILHYRGKLRGKCRRLVCEPSFWLFLSSLSTILIVVSKSGLVLRYGDQLFLSAIRASDCTETLIRTQPVHRWPESCLSTSVTSFSQPSHCLQLSVHSGRASRLKPISPLVTLYASSFLHSLQRYLLRRCVLLASRGNRGVKKGTPSAFLTCLCVVSVKTVSTSIGMSSTVSAIIVSGNLTSVLFHR